MNPLLITHAEDPDGIIARTLLMRYLFVKEKKPEQHVLVRYDQIVEAFQEAVRKVNDYDSVYIADIDLNLRLQKAAGENLSLLEKLSQGRPVSWFDHHEGTLQNKERLAKIGIQAYHDQHQCAAMLIQRHFSLKEPYEIKLAKIAQAHDHRNSSSDHENINIGNELENIIAMSNERQDYNLLLELSYDLSNEKCFDENFKLLPSWQQYSNDFNRQSVEAKKELDNHVEITTAGKYKILFGYCPSLLSQKSGPSHLRETYLGKADIFICLFKAPVRNHILFAPEKSTFSVVPFVQSLGGGGSNSRNGGGFSLDYDLTPENYSSVKEKLLSQIKEYIAQSNSE